MASYYEKKGQDSLYQVQLDTILLNDNVDSDTKMNIMLTEKRHEYILQELKRKGSITVNEIKEELGISESTIRRDLNSLDEEGRLVKVFGGAVSADFEVSGSEPSVMQKREININGKKLIAKYAAGLIEPDDFVYMDAGTTTGCMKIIQKWSSRSKTSV